MKKKTKNTLKENRNEVIWNLINSGLAGLLVLLGSMTAGSITLQGISAGVLAALIVAVTKFRDYWSREEHRYTSKMFNFVR